MQGFQLHETWHHATVHVLKAQEVLCKVKPWHLCLEHADSRQNLNMQLSPKNQNESLGKKIEGISFT